MLAVSVCLYNASVSSPLFRALPVYYGHHHCCCRKLNEALRVPSAGMEFAGMGGDSYSAAPSAGVTVPVEDSDSPAVDDFFTSSFNAATSLADNFQPFPGETRNTSLDFQSNCSPFNLHIPFEEEAELAWLSQFVEDSFSDVPYQYAACHVTPSGYNDRRVDDSTAGRAARSKRSRSSNHPSSVWSSLSTPPPQPSPSSSSSSSIDVPHFLPDLAGTKGSNVCRGRKGAGEHHGGAVGGGERRCTHCASEKTPQWRTGPLGPKTLCNACGVRYKSGRLLPEYRPASSPTFVVAQHSNSHRKVVELRRQKDLHGNISHLTSGPEQQLLNDKGVIC
ncbi:GATA transcription factor 2-like [Curcuma longa]|uniref:GATA transcription factor 2-like n=1 Tax=Curcuma longa TaxID=136217 RepID=UPI003D9F4B98